MAPPPRIRIPQHVFTFSLAMLPAVAYAIYYQRNHPSDEEFEEILREDYSHNIQQSQSRRDDMQKFFKGLEKRDAETERKLSEVMHGGKNDTKRATAVDTALYGTEQGVEAKRRYQDEHEHVRKKKKKKKQKKLEEEEESEHKMMTIDDKESVSAIIKVAAVGTIAAAIVVLLIGANRSR